MCTKLPCVILLLWLLCARGIRAQDLAPRAYLITPLHSNAVTLTYSFYDGNIIFDGSVPITGATARVNVSVLSAYHSFNLFGRTASFLVSLPYGVGNFHGHVAGAETLAYRSGLLPAAFRLSVNLIGGRSMSLDGVPRMAAEDDSWRQPQADTRDGSVRSHETYQLRNQPLGTEARTGPFSSVGTLDS